MRHWKVIRSRDYEPLGDREYGRMFVMTRVAGGSEQAQTSIEFVTGGDEDAAASRLKKFLEREEQPPRRVVVDRLGRETTSSA